MPDIQQLITKNLAIWTGAITNKKTTGRGSNKKIELTGIKKLRELILELAVRGKLVPQDPNDEPASVLLEKIAIEKERLYQEKKIKKQKPLPKISEDEKLFILPLGWSIERFGKIADIERGGSPRPIKDYITNDTEGLNWIKIGDTVKGSKYIISTHEKIRKEGLFKTREVFPGDFLLTNSMSFGRPYITKINGCIHDGWLRIHPPEILQKDYLYNLLSSSYVMRFFIATATGAVVQNLNKDKVRLLPLPIPPLAEQHRIVAKVDELMALCDQLEQQTEQSISAHQTLVDTLLNALVNSEQDAMAFADSWKLIEQNFELLFTTEQSIDKLKQTILQLAVMGKLVPQDHSDEPASVLLEKITAEKERLVKEKKIKKQKPLPEISEDEKPFELPKGWLFCRVMDIAKLITSGSRDWAKYYSDNGAIFVTMGNLSRGSYQLRMNTIKYVNPPRNGEGSRTKLEENDLIISITGDVGNLGLIPNNFGDAYINQHTCLLRFMHSCQNRYFPELMRSPLAKLQFDAPQRGIKNSFRLGDVGKMIIPVPPEKEQHRIVKKVDNLLTLCDNLKSQLINKKTTQQNLATALVEQTLTNNSTITI